MQEKISLCSSTNLRNNADCVICWDNHLSFKCQLSRALHSELVIKFLRWNINFVKKKIDFDAIYSVYTEYTEHSVFWILQTHQSWNIPPFAGPTYILRSKTFVLRKKMYILRIKRPCLEVNNVHFLPPKFRG